MSRSTSYPRSTLLDKNQVIPLILLALLLLVLGLTVLYGWITANHTLVQIELFFPYMQLTAAIGFVLSGLALFSIAFQWHLTVRVCSILLFTLSLFSIVQHIYPAVWEWEEHLIQRLFGSIPFPSYPLPIPTLSAFFISSIALYFISLKKKKLLFYASISVVGTIVYGIGFNQLIQYAFDTSLLQRTPTAAVAIHACFGLMILGFAIAYYSYIVIVHSLAPQLVNWFLLQIAILSSFFGYTIWSNLISYEENNLSHMVEHNAIVFSNALNFTLVRDYASVIRMANRWDQHEEYSKNLWESDALNYLNSYRAMKGIEWIDTEGHRKTFIKEVFPEQEKQIKEWSFSYYENMVKEREKVDRFFIDLFDDRIYLLYFLPIQKEGKDDGHLVIYYDLNFVLSMIQSILLFENEHFNVHVNGKEIFFSGVCSQDNGKIYIGSSSFPFIDTFWEVQTCLDPIAQRRYYTYIPFFVAFVIAVSTVLLLFVLYYYFQSQVHKKKFLESEHATASFLGSVSHEIRTPLQGILGTSSLLETTPLNPNQERLVHITHESGKILLDLINDIIDLSRIDAGDLVFSFEEVSLKPYFNDITDLFQDHFAKKNLYLKFETRLSDEETGIIEPKRLRQILINLIGNALKFTSEGGVTLYVEKCTFWTGTSWSLLIRVMDTGKGIPREKMPYIFDRFFQVDASHTTETQGTGLGLTITKKMIEKMNGTITVESEEGVGSVFTMTIPLIPPENTGKKKTMRKISSSFPSLRVLIAEDYDFNLEILVQMMSLFGMEKIDTAMDGVQVLEKFAASCKNHHCYDVLFLDMHMPKKDGYEVVKEIKQTCPNPPSSYCDYGECSWAREAAML